jgi:hypothetical protein
MNDGFAWWLVVLGIAIGVGLSWLVLGRLPRTDADIGEDERAVEAAWISRAITDYGGVAPPALVEEVLELHGHYLRGPALDPGRHSPDGSEDELTEGAVLEGEIVDGEVVDGEVRSRR